MRVLFVEKQLDYEPQGIMQLSAVLKEAGHDVAITIASQEDPVQFAYDFQPDVLGYSVMTGSQGYYFDLNRQIRERLNDKTIHSIFGGPHPTFFPEMIEEPGVNSLCVGEGEGALVDVVNSLAEGKLRTDIANMWFNVDGEIIKNPVRPLIRSLGELPMPDHSLIYDKHVYMSQAPVKHFLASRGCPYACTYCFNHAYYQIYKGEKRGNQRPVDSIIAEVNAIREKWPLENAVFIDDLFIVFDSWLEELAEKWPEQVGLPFFCNVRADLLVKNPRKVELLKKAGCSTVSMGIESANDRIRLKLLKRRMTQEDMVKAGRMVRDAGMHITTTNILGLPTSTLEDDLLTMRLNAEARISYAHAFIFQPYPGTELGQYAQDNDFMVGTFDDIPTIAWDKSILVRQDPKETVQVEHLQRLFAIGVEHPWMEPIIRKLIKLPHNKLVDTIFWLMHKSFKGYAISRRVHPTSFNLRHLWNAASHFFRMDA